MKRRAIPPKRRRRQTSTSNDDNTDGLLQVLLTATKPRPQCSVFTEAYGTFCITATTKLKPDVKTLSTVQPKCGEWHEVPIHVFGNTPKESRLQEHLACLVDHTPEPSIPDFLKQSERIFQELITLTKESSGVSTKTDATPSSPWSLAYAEELTRQLEELEQAFGNDAVEKLSDDLLRLTLKYQDQAGRTHRVTLKMTLESFHDSDPECSSELPITWQPPWQPGGPQNEDESPPAKRFKVDPNELGGTDEIDARSGDHHHLLRLYSDYVKMVDKCQGIWNELDNLDANTWVLEPSTRPPSRSVLERRIAVLEGASSIVIRLDPMAPRAPPKSVRWIGAETSQHQDKVQRYMNSIDQDSGWSPQYSVKENLERGLGFQLPLPPSASSSEETLLECSICYTHDLPTDESSSEFPDAVCDNEPCKRYYHETCLREWLQSLPTSRKSFDRIIGTCPYCSELISATMKQG